MNMTHSLGIMTVNKAYVLNVISKNSDIDKKLNEILYLQI